MRIALVSDSKENLELLTELQAALKKRILDAEVKLVLVPLADNIPAKISELADKTSLFFVLVYYDELNFKVKALLSKLIDLEIDKKTKIIKEISEKEQEDGFYAYTARREKAKKFSEMIIDYLFHSERH